MKNLGRDVRVALQRLRQSPWSSLVIILTLALCIGTSTALFTVIKGALLDPWPYKSPDRIVVLGGNFPKLGHPDMEAWSVPEYFELAKQDRIFDAIVAGVASDVDLTEGDQPEHLHAVQMTASGFQMLGVQPLLGRVYTPAEDRPGGEKVVVLAYGLWERRYNSDPHIVGKTLRIAGQPYQVIGVMPKRFLWWSANLFFPIGLDPSSIDRSQRRLTVQARLRPGLSLESAQAQLSVLARRLQADHISTNPEYENFNFNLKLLKDEVLRDVRPSLVVLLCFMIVVYLMACANIANLVLAKAALRRREMAVRMAMGASRGQLARQVLAESLVLTVPGALLGLGLAALAVKLALAMIPFGYIPAEAVVEIDASAVLFSLALAVLAAVLCGVAPAREASRPANVEVLREGGQRSTSTVQVRRLQDALVVAEVVMALVVLVAAGLMIQSYIRLTAISPGYDPKNVLTLRVSLPADRYAEGRQVSAFVNEVLARVQRIPGVEAAGGVNSLPLTNGPSLVVTLEGVSAADLGAIPEANARVATPGYFPAMRIPIVQGRNFGNQDVEGSLPVVLVNQTMARRFWPGKNPIGKRMKMGDAASTNPWLTVVGIVGDVREERLDAEPRQQFYMPHAQRAFRVRDLALVVRSNIKAESLTDTLRKTILALDASQPVYKVQTMEEIVLNSLGAKRLTLVLLSVFGLTSLLLAAVGIFAVLANLVNNRQQEIGIRMALGAQLQTVVRLFVGHGLKLTAVGIVLGLVAALFSSRVLASLVYGVSTTDPLTFAGIALLFTAIATVASYIPARRAGRIDPMASLNPE